MNKKCLESLQINISYSYCKKYKHQLHPQSSIEASSSIAASIAFTYLFLFFIRMFTKKQAFKCLFKILLYRKIFNS